MRRIVANLNEREATDLDIVIVTAMRYWRQVIGELSAKESLGVLNSSERAQLYAYLSMEASTPRLIEKFGLGVGEDFRDEVFGSVRGD